MISSKEMEKEYKSREKGSWKHVSPRGLTCPPETRVERVPEKQSTSFVAAGITATVKMTIISVCTAFYSLQSQTLSHLNLMITV